MLRIDAVTKWQSTKDLKDTDNTSLQSKMVWLGAKSNKGGWGERNCKEIGAGACYAGLLQYPHQNTQAKQQWFSQQPLASLE